jgi:UDP-N-acetylglucosamine transferase subunit ALG13
VIYITVGTYPQGFERLIRYMDNICLELKLDCVAQISGGKFLPKNMKHSKFFTIEEQEEHINNSDIIISHGGFGIIGDLLRKNKTFIVFPRPPAEGPNDQRPVAKKLSKTYGFSLCESVESLKNEIIRLQAPDNPKPNYLIGSDVSEIISQYLLNG